MQEAPAGGTSVNGSASGSSDGSSSPINGSVNGIEVSITSSTSAFLPIKAELNSEARPHPEAHSKASGANSSTDSFVSPLASYRSSQLWLGQQSLSVAAGSSLLEPTAMDLSALSAETPRLNFHLPAGSALTGTALLSTGLIASLIGIEPAPTPTGEAFIPQQPLEQPSLQGLYSQDYAQAIALDQGTGISPQVALAPLAAFSQQLAPQSDYSGMAYTEAAYTEAAYTEAAYAEAAYTEAAYTETAYADATYLEANAAATANQQPNNSWTLSDTQPLANAQPAAYQQSAATRALVSQLAQMSSGNTSTDVSTAAPTRLACLASSCQSLMYVEKALPEAQRKALDIQNQLDAFAVRHGQSDIETYSAVLAARRSEIAQQKNQTTIDLLDTERYIGQIHARLIALDVAPALASRVLAADANYQADWQALQLIESRLAAEFSAANADGTALNKIYTDYEIGRRSLYQSAQDALGSYLISEASQGIGQDNNIAAAIHKAPGTIDLLQALVISTHQQDVQQLRLETARKITSNLDDRQRALVKDMTQYKALQRKLASTQTLIAQYEQARIGISKAAIEATEVVNSMQTEVATEVERNGAVSAAQMLEAMVPEGSTAKALLGIVVAAGAVAVAIKRTHGDLSEDVVLEITPKFAPQSGRTLWDVSRGTGSVSLSKRLTNSLRADWMSQMLDGAGPPVPAFAAQGPTFSYASEPVSHTEARPEAHPGAASANSPLGRQLSAGTPVGAELSIETLSQELTQIVQESTPEAASADAVITLSMEPVALSLNDLDGFAENVVRWVLQDAASMEQEGVESENVEPENAEPENAEPENVESENAEHTVGLYQGMETREAAIA